MSKTNMVFRAGRLAAALFAAAGWFAVPAEANPASGEAVVAARAGQAEARVFTGPVHEGRTDKRELQEGMAVGEKSSVLTGKDGRLCLVLSPGAIVCVAPQTEFAIQHLRHTADGLPKTEEDLIRRIHLDLKKGRILVRAGTPMPTMDIRITTPAGRIESQGGSFVVAESGKGEWMVYSETGDQSIVPRGGNAVPLAAGGSAKLFQDGAGPAEVDRRGAAADSDLFQFELCSTFFSDLDPFIQNVTEFDRTGLAQYLGLTAPILPLDSGALVTDASPSIRPPVGGTLPSELPRIPAGEPGGRWSPQRIWDWYADLGAVKGVNYIPRTAVNSVEMWMADTFNPDIIDEELAWAEKIGYNAIRVQLQHAVWKADPEGFLDRVEQLLDIAAGHGLRVVPVMFDDLNVAGSAPAVGAQPEPVPGVHNSRWVPSPGAKAVTDRGQWPDLEKYLTDVMGNFKRDRRILYWDLYNTAGNAGLWEDTLPLLEQTFNWAREIDPGQPLAVPAWDKYGSAMTSRKLERSDLVTFQSFENVETIEAHLLLLQRYQRPIICSDWLVRQLGSDFEKVLPLFATYRVGWFNRGLVSGKTQLQVQDKQYRNPKAPDVWQQNVLREDGTPYDKKEVELIQGFRYLEAPQ